MLGRSARPTTRSRKLADLDGLPLVAPHHCRYTGLLDHPHAGAPMDRRIALAWHADRDHLSARALFVEYARATTKHHRAPSNF